MPWISAVVVNAGSASPATILELLFLFLSLGDRDRLFLSAHRQTWYNRKLFLDVPKHQERIGIGQT